MPPRRRKLRPASTGRQAYGAPAAAFHHFTYRLVLKLDRIGLLSSHVIGQLLLLDKWIRAHQGVMRLCELSADNIDVRHCCGLDELFPAHRDRLEAVLGSQRPSFQ
jgi:hypothetical protein